MRELPYQDFSLNSHQKFWHSENPATCQFELTFGCNLHCRHCYSDCYNNPKDLKKELTTKQIISVLNKIYDSGVFWLCLTGGDPLTKKDFLGIYAYAKKKGFIVTIFTNATLVTDEVADYFEKLTPFAVEVTLNAADKQTYEEVSGVKGSFNQAMAGINRLMERSIPFKIKTMATQQNYEQLGSVKSLVEKFGSRFRPSSMIFARLDGDTAPCRLRLEPEQVLEINGRFGTNSMDEEEPQKKELLRDSSSELIPNNLFRCAAGSDTFHIDPYGNMFLCSTVREPNLNLLTGEIADGLKIITEIKAQKFKTASKCKTCKAWHFCHQCPGRAKIEMGDAEKPIPYFCKLAHLMAEETKQEAGIR